MPTTPIALATYQFKLEFFNEAREAVHEVPLAAADFHRAVEAAFFEGLRSGRFPDYDLALDQARVVPRFEEEAGSSPRAEGFSVAMPAADGQEHRVEFPTSFFECRATRIGAELLRTKKLSEGNKVLYQLAAYLDEDRPGPRRSKITLDAESVQVPIRTRSRRRLGRSEPWDQPVVGDMPVLIPRHVIEESVEDAKRNPEREVGGVLLGHLGRDDEDGTLFLEVTCQVPAEETEATVTSVTFTSATWQRVREVIAIRGEGEVFAGWAHSHPFRFCKDCPLPTPPECVQKVLFYSSDDEFLMEQTFARPFMIGLLTAVEPKLEQSLGHLPVRLFGWRNGEIQSRGFEVIDV